MGFGPCALFVLVAGVIVAGIVYGIYATAQRRKELSAWAAGRWLSFDQGKDYSFQDQFPNFDCLRQGDDDRYAYNMMTGKWSGREISAFDYHYRTHSTDSKGNRSNHDHYFSAVVVGSAVPLQPLFIRPEGFFDKVAEFFGADDIDFESAEFSRKFFVKAPDKKWAYDVIHQRTMEFLLAQPMFSIKFDRQVVIAHRGTTFKPADFEAAAGVVCGILDRLPEYLVRQQLDGDEKTVNP